MFDFLKKKITDFTDRLAGKATEQKPETAEQTELGETAVAPKDGKKGAKVPVQEEETGQETPETGRGSEEKVVEKEAGKQPEEHGERFDAAGEDRDAEEKIKEVRGDEKRELRAKLGILKKISGLAGWKIRISESETEEFFGEFELSLLESDVEQETAEAIVKELKERLLGREIPKKEDVSAFLKREVKEALKTIMETEGIEILTRKEKPLKILFIGPNGAGKTTTIAKIAKRLMDNGKSVILAAGDTFRAAAIDQLQEHADRLGVKMVRHKYGADPAAVAFDAVKMAEAKKIDVVLIDSAGRQDTNKNLIGEMKKIDRVVKPHLKLYVGEAYTGQALLDQAGEFDNAVNLDGFVLTKIDADPKGGTAISLLHKFKKPIVFVGTGQRYEDLLEFKPEFIINRVL